MAIQTIFSISLLVGVALSHWRRCPLLVRSAWVLAGNNIACQLAVATTGTYDPVAWFAAIDVVSAVVLLWRPAGRTQAVIGAVYIIQLGLHFAQWPGGVAQYQYLSVMTVAGGCQIVFLFLGAVDNDGHKNRGFGRWRGNHDYAVAHGRGRLEKGQQP